MIWINFVLSYNLNNCYTKSFFNEFVKIFENISHNVKQSLNIGFKDRALISRKQKLIGEKLISDEWKPLI